MAGRRRSGGGGHGGGGEERWLLPYADMITLLLGLFIVLFAMSTINPHKYDNLRRSLSQTFHGQVTEEPGGVTDGSTSVLDPSAAAEANAIAQSVTQAAQSSAAQMNVQKQRLQAIVKQAKLGNDVKVTSNEKGIKLTLAGDALFASGQSTLNPAVIEKLTKLERALAKTNRPIEIAGHTDGQPYVQAGGNYRLSAERSLAVVMFFMNKHYPGKMIPKYLGDTEPVHPIKPGHEHDSIKENRRIEITILAPGVDDPRGAAVGVSEVLRRQATTNRAANGRVGTSPESNSEVQAQLQKEIDSGIVNEITAVSASQQ